MITIFYFGQLSDQLNTSTEQIDWLGGTTDDLLNLLRQRGEPWHSALQSDKIFKIAVNKVLQHNVIEIADGSEIGFLPPVTGG